MGNEQAALILCLAIFFVIFVHDLIDDLAHNVVDSDDDGGWQWPRKK